MDLRIAACDSPLGPLAAEFTSSGALCRLDFLHGPIDAHIAARSADRGSPVRYDQAVASELALELDEYFAGRLRGFRQVLELEGTDFQRAVWAALLEIPFGEVTSYGALAARLGKPGASRAVGAANGANPVPILVPCHRVIAADGGLGGFSAGLHNKRALLELEGSLAPLFDRAVS